MRRAKQLAWDEYWTLVLRLNKSLGLSASIPVSEMESHYRAGKSPLDASYACVHKQLVTTKDGA